MKFKATFHCLYFLLFTISMSGQQPYYPGGVPGAEVWYTTSHQHLSTNYFPNVLLSSRVRELRSCDLNATKSLFNFNESFKAEKLCLMYSSPLENTNSRNVFFVGEPIDIDANSSHLTTGWNTSLGNLFMPDSIIRNRFDLANKLSYINKKTFTYLSDQNANVNFYNWNRFQVDRKLKSYGYDGESYFYIGRSFNNAVTPAKYFAGNFPEFISFPFELTDNQKNRVESYLALKYGLTLSKGVGYRNSKNVTFWKQSNNNLFMKRIFGIGRDDISGLNQLQSESTHFRDFLVKSVGEFAETNLKKQEQVHIENGSFLVSADNGRKEVLGEENHFSVRKLERIWLTQKTGDENIPIYFTLTVTEEIHEILDADPSQKLWLLHDKYVTNQQISDFNSQYVDYYNPEEPFDLQTATFKNVYFDRDENIFDQFTFGVGPQMIVQVRFDGDCKTKEIAATVVITGGRAPYNVQVSNDAGYYEAFNVAGQTQEFTAEPPYSYLVKVMDVNGLIAQTTVQAEYFEMDLDLGPDVILNTSQTSVTLDAGQDITDPNATYQWYLDGNPIEAFGSTLTVTQPGKYSVSVTSGNKKCVLKDDIVVYYKFGISVQPFSDCGKKDGSLTITLSGGIAPFTTVISGNGQNIVQVHNSEVIYSTGMDYGTYNVTSTDINGNMYQTTVVISPPYDGIAVNLYSQAAQICSSSNGVFSCPTAILNASQQVTNPNVSYQWFINGVSANIYTPAVQFTYNANYCANLGYGAGFNEYRVRITNLATGCYKEDAIVAGSCYGLQAYPSGGAVQRIVSDSKKETEPASEQSQFVTKVYPNPSKADALFNYEINSSKGIFNGVVEIHSPTGALISSTTITGQDSYKLPFSLLSSGVYFITVKTNSTIITDKVIIK